MNLHVTIQVNCFRIVFLCGFDCPIWFYNEFKSLEYVLYGLMHNIVN